MNQDDIYNLLLMMLMLGNERGNADTTTVSTRSSLNELMITAMLLSSCSGRDELSCPRAGSNTNTTF